MSAYSLNGDSGSFLRWPFSFRMFSASKRAILFCGVMVGMLLIHSGNVFSQEEMDDGLEGLEELLFLPISFKVSIAKALGSKLEADYILDAVSSEDIGKFPTENVAEALQTISGVSISRSRGEGLLVSVRGLGPIFQSTTMNGHGMAVNENVENSRQSGREFRYDVLPSQLVSGIEVIKTPTADMDEGAIGGIVNIKTFRPLELKTVKFTGSVQTVFSELSDEWDPRISGLTSWINRDENFGWLVAGSYTERSVRQDRMLTFDWELGGHIDGVFNPRRVRPTIEIEDRERFGFLTAAQWNPNENWNHNVDWFYAKFTTKFDEFGIDIELDRGTVTSPIVSGNSLLAGILSGTRFQASRETSEQEHENYVFGYDMEWTSGDWTVSGVLSFAEAESETIEPIQRNRLRVSGVTIDFDYRGGSGSVPDLIPVGIDIATLTSFPGRRIEYRPIISVDEEFAIGVDVERTLEGFFTSVKGGVKFRDRERDYDRRDIRVSDGISGVTFDPALFAESLPSGKFLDDFSGNFPLIWAVPSDTAFFDTFFDPALVNEPRTTGDKRNSYNVVEEITAYYLRGDIKAHWGAPVTGNIGLRIAETRQTSKGHGGFGGGCHST